MSLTRQIEQMLNRAKADYQRAAAAHAMSRVAALGGRIEALEDILKLIDDRIS